MSRDQAAAKKRVQLIKNLPTLPGMIEQISTAVESQRFSVADIGKLISRDQVLSAKVLKPAGSPGRFERLVERFFGWLANGYRRSLHGALDTLPVILVAFSLLMIVVAIVLIVRRDAERRPREGAPSTLRMAALGVLTGLLEVADHPMHLVIIDEGAMDTSRHAATGLHVQHVTMAQQVLRTHLVQDGA